ncbi:MAG TPA: AlkA N-terminal domain-containing protein [Thermoanaerobaculia bacterium]|nr:AlkA N-terminal domain-containing protein [Thermoanaerobaculia bacterium]
MRDRVMKMMTEIEIRWRAPLDWEHLAGFLSRRAIPGVESFDVDGYTRAGIRVRRDGRRRRFVASVPPGVDATEAGVRIARMFDAAADSRSIAARLGRDPMLRPLLDRHRGIRVPGGWDAFEIVIRAIVGQQISVAAARSIVGSIAGKCGERTNGSLSFPTAAQIVSSKLELGMPRRRLESIRAVSAAVASGAFALEKRSTLEETISALEELPGIGPWSASYIAMRGLGETDAFPAGDLILRRNAGMTEQQLTRRAERWRPYRAYAAMLLWAK